MNKFSNGNETDYSKNFEDSKLNLAFIRANWHIDIVDESRKAFVSHLSKNGIPKQRIEIFDVPGSYEIPLLAKQLATSGKYLLIVGCGFVINGGIYRHEFVAQAVVEGMMKVQLETEVPVLSVVLTPHNYHETEEHHQFFFKHFQKKGIEAAEAALMVMKNTFQINPSISAR